MYDRIIKKVKKILHRLLYEEMSAVVIDIKCNQNNWPLTFIESDGGEPQDLMLTTILLGN